MLSEKEMYARILSWAKVDEKVRAVWINGSRADPNAVRDPFQDFDVVFAVDEVKPYVTREFYNEFTARFGDVLIAQEPNANGFYGPVPPVDEEYAYLIQFMDGRRIDLTVSRLDIAIKKVRDESQTVILYDPEKLLPPIPPASDRDYWIEKPDLHRFRARCNNFWWVCPYVAKALWRGQLLHAVSILDVVRDELVTMLCWRAGHEQGFDMSMGKHSWKLKDYLPEKLYEELLSTYPHAEEGDIWRALENVTKMVSRLAPALAEKLGYKYNATEQNNVLEYIKLIKTLPRDAEEIR